jgi:hypothetical protein
VPRCEPLDLEDSLEYVQDPSTFTVTYPFGWKVINVQKKLESLCENIIPVPAACETIKYWIKIF